MNNLFWFDNVDFRTHPWPGLNWVTTLIQVPDVRKARELYVSVFKFVPIFDLPDPQDKSNLITCRLRYRGANFVLTKEGSDYEGVSPATSNTSPPFVFYVYVDNVDEIYKAALGAGMQAVLEPNETRWGDKRARLKCSNGYLWDIAQRIS